MTISGSSLNRCMRTPRSRAAVSMIRSPASPSRRVTRSFTIRSSSRSLMDIHRVLYGNESSMRLLTKARSSAMAASISLLYFTLRSSGIFSGCPARSMAVLIRSSRPSPLLPMVNTTGTPRSTDSLAASIFRPRDRARSAILSAKITRVSSSRSWLAR